MAQAADDATRRRLLKEHRIFFDLNKRQAPGHEELFDDIKQLGQYDYEQYRSNITIESKQKPWRQDILGRAKFISAGARRCIEMNKNESSWRLNLESDILKRFTVEVVWIWRSEMEVSANTIENSLDSLAERQKRRQTCQCPSRLLDGERSGEGMNPLFDDRAEEEVQHDSEINRILKTGKRPDRVIGLRVTSQLDRILNQAGGPLGYTVRDSIKTSPFKDDCEPLLLPFLVLEAKSEKSSDPFSKINLQTGFAIHALLKLQHDLVNASIDNQQAAMMPLVWFLSNKGEIWRLSGAYIEETEVKREPSYRILDLWEGNITYEEQALRLLLIVDYIFDWARDDYRKNIRNNLLSLVTHQTPSLADASDVYSTVGRFLDSDEISMSDSASDVVLEQSQSFGVPKLFKSFDIQDYAMRDAKFMCHRFCAFHITLGNLDKFYYSVRSMKEAQQLARRLWKGIVGPNSWSVTAGCLNAVERLWTNQDRQLHTFQNPEEPFLAYFEIKSYLSNGKHLSSHSNERSGQWDQIHQLTYIAIAHDALEPLKQRTQFKSQNLRMRYQQRSEAPQEKVINLLKQIRFAPVRTCLAAAVSRTRLCSSASKAISGKRYLYHPHSGVKHYEPSLIQNNDAKFGAAELPWVMYKRLKVGMKEPSESFLRVSQQLTEHDLDKRPTDLVSGWADWAWKFQDYNAVLVAGLDTGDIEKRRGDDCVNYCIFILDRSPRYGSSMIEAYPEVLLAFLNIRRIEKYNFPYKAWNQSSDFQIALKILKRISYQYGVVRSLNDKLTEEELNQLIDKQKILDSSENSRWLGNYKDSVDGIKQYGEIYGLDQMLKCLRTAFKKQLKKQSKESVPRMLIDIARRLKTSPLDSAEGHTIPKRSSRDEPATIGSSDPSSIVFQPFADEPEKVDMPELIILDQPAIGVNYKRTISQSSGANDMADSKELITKRPRT